MAPDPLLAVQDRLALRELVGHWAPEIGLHWRNLANALFQSIVDGEFDHLELGHGVLKRNPNTSGVFPITGEALYDEITAVPNGNLQDFFAIAFDQNWIALHRDAVLFFATKRRIAPPSWWAVEEIKSGAPGRPTSAHLVEAEMRRRADAGELLSNLKSEAKVLSAWLAAVHPVAAPMSPKTIQNQLSEAYRSIPKSIPK